MSRWIGLIVTVCIAVFAFGQDAEAQTQSRIGLGFHYWKALEDVDLDNIDEDGLGLVISYKLVPTSALKFQADVEILPRGYAASEHRVVAPQAFLLAGDGLYAALGIGMHYSDGDFADKPFFALRTGLDIELVPALFADININYRFEEWDFDEAKSGLSIDTLTLGVVVRFAIGS